MRKLAALTVATTLAVGLSLTLTSPAEARDCPPPALDPANLVVQDNPTVVGPSDPEVVYVTAGLFDPCHQIDAMTLTVATPASEQTYDLVEVDAAADEPLRTFVLDLEVAPDNLVASEAGTWDTVFTAHDNDVAGDLVVAGPAVRVLRATKLSVNAAPEPVKKGKTLTVTGSLDRADWKTFVYVPFVAKKVDLEFATRGGAYKKVKTLTTSSSGDVRTTVTAGKDGYYRLVYAGNSTSAAVTTKGDYVDVR